MAYDFQIVVDCQRPHELADWWAETLAWVVEQQDEDFIRKMIAEGYATDAETVAGQVKVIKIPAWAQPKVQYGICVVSASKNKTAAHAFIQLVLSRKGQKELLAYKKGLTV